MKNASQRKKTKNEDKVKLWTEVRKINKRWK